MNEVIWKLRNSMTQIVSSLELLALVSGLIQL